MRTGQGKIAHYQVITPTCWNASPRDNSAPCIGSMHGIDLRRVLDLAGRSDTPQVLAFGIEPAHIGWSMTLSAEVERSLPRLIETVSTEVGLQFFCAPSDIQRSRAR